MINGELFLTNDFALDFLSILYDRAFEYPTFEVYTVDPADLMAYEGVYGAPDFPLKLTIAAEGEQLKAQGTGQPAFILNAVGQHQFDFKKAKLALTFVLEKQQMILVQGGQTIVLTKE